MHQNSRISMLKSENFLVRISKFPLRGYKTRQDTELPLKSQIFRSRLENTSKQRNRVQTQHRNAHPRLSKNSKTSSASLLKARNPSYFSVRKLQNTHPQMRKLQNTPRTWVGAFLTLNLLVEICQIKNSSKYFLIEISHFRCGDTKPTKIRNFLVKSQNFCYAARKYLNSGISLVGISKFSM